jgi:fucose permease
MSEIHEYGMVLFWSHFMTHFSQSGLIFDIVTSKSFDGLIFVSVVFWGLIAFGLTSLLLGLFGSHFGHQNGLLFGLVSVFLGLAQGETNTRPRKTQTRPSRPQ